METIVQDIAQIKCKLAEFDIYHNAPVYTSQHIIVDMPCTNDENDMRRETVRLMNNIAPMPLIDKCIVFVFKIIDIADNEYSIHVFDKPNKKRNAFIRAQLLWLDMKLPMRHIFKPAVWYADAFVFTGTTFYVDNLQRALFQQVGCVITEDANNSRDLISCLYEHFPHGFIIKKHSILSVMVANKIPNVQRYQLLCRSVITV